MQQTGSLAVWPVELIQSREIHRRLNRVPDFQLWLGHLMIQYDPHRWFDHFFDIRGSLLKEISGRVSVCVLWAIAVVAFHLYVHPVGAPATVHTLVGTALGLLLVFRTNASYDRYWEGRRLWGGIVNECRNLVRAASVQLQDAPDLVAQVTLWTALFPWTAKSVLRGERDFGPLIKQLSEQDLASTAGAQHPALHVARRISSLLHQGKQRGVISDIVQISLDQNVHLLVGYLGGCERILKTPLPYAYVVHLRRVVVVYCFTLPFALVESFGWTTVLDVLLVAYTFFGIEEIGVEIEGPFGSDENDLPLEDISMSIQAATYSLAGIQAVCGNEHA